MTPNRTPDQSTIDSNESTTTVDTEALNRLKFLAGVGQDYLRIVQWLTVNHASVQFHAGRVTISAGDVLVEGSTLSVAFMKIERATRSRL